MIPAEKVPKGGCIIKHIPGNTPDTDESGPSLNFVPISRPKQDWEYDVTVTSISRVDPVCPTP